MDSDRKNFHAWYVKTLESLYPERNAGIAILMISTPLLERYLRQKNGRTPDDQFGGGVIHQPVLNPDSKRINNEVGKHAVGLYYEVAGRPLSPAYGTIVLPWRWLDRIPAEDRPVWESVIAWALRGHRRAIGDGSVFQFALKVADDNADGFVALLLYYDNFAYAVRSYERPALAAP
jgi:hypothetical protein